MTAAVEPIVVEDESAKSSAGLAARFRPLRTRPGGMDRWLLMVGGIALPLGLLLIILGWVGASNTPFEFEQIPYVISGGLLGLALVFLGGFIYFAYWQTRVLREARENQEQLVAELRNIAKLVGNANANGNGHAASASALDIVSNSDTFVTTEKGSMFHRADCPVVQGRDKLRVVRGDEGGLRPCGICNPVVTTAS